MDMETININQIHHAGEAMESLSDVAARAQRDLGILDDQLLCLRLNFGKLRAAMERTFAPLAATVLPVIDRAVRALTDFCDDAGAVMAALFGTVYKKAVSTTKKTGSAIRRTLASFDEIQRLGGASGSGSTTSVTLEPVNDPLTPQLEQIVLKIQALLEPLRHIDLTAAGESFRALGQTIAQLGGVLSEHLQWAWFNLLVPLAKWTLEEAVPASVDALSAAFTLLRSVLTPVMEGIRQLKPALEPVGVFLGQTLVQLIGTLRGQFTALAELFTIKAPEISGVFLSLGQTVTALFTRVQPVLQSLGQLWSALLGAMSTAAAEWSGFVLAQLQGITAFFTGVLTGDWGRAWEGLKAIFKGAVNGIIALLNGLLSGLASGLNAVSAALNRWSVKIPEWVPAMGGKTFGFRLGTVTAPQIPYLAKGAVLPANKPFLAVVGDQRHGTNVEAPLATIQQAVALAMEDMAQGNLAGHQATVDLLGQILQAVLGIRIGDEVIAQACDRSLQRQAVMRGGSYAG